MSHLSSTPVIARIFLLAGVLLAILALLSPSHFPAYAQVAPEQIMYPENSTHTVAAYTAMDPEGKDIVWTLTETGTGDFSIEGGVLTFNESPDFEDPKGGPGDDSNTYIVTVIAADPSDTDLSRDSVMVTVNVTNEEEPGTVKLLTLQPKEGFELTAELTDPDGQPGAGTDTDLTAVATTTWQWARSSSANGPWTDIEADDEATPPVTSESATYTPGPDDVGSYLRATATYTDGHSPPDTDPEDPDKSAQAVSAHAVQPKDYVPSAPIFPDQDPDTEAVENEEAIRIISENSAPGTAVGDPVAATDIGADGSQEVLTYTLGGDDASSFDINRQTGQITVGAGTTLDYEDDANIDRQYEVTVTATDPRRMAALITVTINVTNVDEKPSISAETSSAGHSARDHAENTPITTAVSTYTATDPEDDDATLNWSLSGVDSARFEVSNTSGVSTDLSFKSSPDYEARADRGGNNVYDVKVIVTDSDGQTASRDVAVTVTNVEEPGTIVLVFDSVRPDTPMLQPEVGTRIRAKLTDDDVPSNVSWQWQRNGTPIDGATSATYTPKTTPITDLDTTLQVTATYTDGCGSGTPGCTNNHEVSQPSGQQVQAKPIPDPSPQFINSSSDPITTFAWTVNENLTLDLIQTSIDDNIPGVRANDGDTLSFSLTGSDADSFSIQETSASAFRLTAKEGLAFDYETKRSYSFTIQAVDPSGDLGRLSVTINVGNENESPEISEQSPIDYAENGTGSVAPITANDPERARLSWTLSGDDMDDFDISARGVLTFKSPPDFENPTDSGTNNGYSVTVIASDGTNTPNLTVVVNVTNVDEPGTVALQAVQPKEGAPIVATLADPDGGETGETWQWARSSSRNGPWTDIADATADTYTPGPDDVRMFLRAEATYTDDATNPEDNPSTTNVDESKDVAAGVSVNPVLMADYVNTVPKFLDQDPETDDDETQTAPTRKVAENSASGTAVGDPVTATDLGSDGMQEVLLYTLAGTDASSFDIDRATGQLKTKEDLDYEDSTNTDHKYEVTVTASDPSDTNSNQSRATVTVTIEVTDVDEDPSITEGADKTTLTEITDAPDRSETTVTHDGDTPSTVTPADDGTVTLATYPAADDDDDNDEEDDNTTLTWSLSGADSDKFSISNDTDTLGQLTFKGSLNFEDPTDSGRNNVYNVTVVVTDSDDDTDSQEVTVEVINQEEDGVVTLSNLQPEDGVQIRATLTDPDGGITGLTWQWAYGDNEAGTGTFTDIADAKSSHV